MKQNNSSIINRFTSKGVFPHQFAFTLLIPLRNVFLSPQKLIQRLDLKETYHVLEVGPGPGYFSCEVARVLKSGKLVLTDVQKEMLDYAKKRLNKKNIFNVEYNLCNGIDFTFESNQFDIIYMVTVLGEIENKQQYVKEFYRILRPGGILSISEQGGDPDKISIKEIENLLDGSGFELEKCYGTERNFTINFRK